MIRPPSRAEQFTKTVLLLGFVLGLVAFGAWKWILEPAFGSSASVPPQTHISAPTSEPSVSTPSAAPTDVPTPVPRATYRDPVMVGSPDTPTPAQMQAFADSVHSAVNVESATINDLNTADLADGQTGIPVLQDAYKQAFRAADIAANGPNSPWDVVGGRLFLALTDEQTQTLKMLTDFGTTNENIDRSVFFAAHDKVLAIVDELHQRGY